MGFGELRARLESHAQEVRKVVHEDVEHLKEDRTPLNGQNSLVVSL